jgi:hypothetical protein
MHARQGIEVLTGICADGASDPWRFGNQRSFHSVV